MVKHCPESNTAGYENNYASAACAAREELKAGSKMLKPQFPSYKPKKLSSHGTVERPLTNTRNLWPPM